PFARSLRPERDSGPLAHIHVSGVKLTPDNRAYIRRKLGTKLGKFRSSIERVTVRVEDLNGPKGGVDQVCRIKVVLSGLPSVVVEKRDPFLDAALDLALGTVERAVARAVRRRRMRRVI